MDQEPSCFIVRNFIYLCLSALSICPYLVAFNKRSTRMDAWTNERRRCLMLSFEVFTVERWEQESLNIAAMTGMFFVFILHSSSWFILYSYSYFLVLVEQNYQFSCPFSSNILAIDLIFLPCFQVISPRPFLINTNPAKCKN